MVPAFSVTPAEAVTSAMPYIGLDSPSTSPSAPVANEPTAVLSDAPSTTVSLAGGVVIRAQLHRSQ